MEEASQRGLEKFQPQVEPTNEVQETDMAEVHSSQLEAAQVERLDLGM